jgi:hypothetical protein
MPALQEFPIKGVFTSPIKTLYTENGAVGVNLAHPNSNYLELLQRESLLKFSAIPDGSTL